MLIRDTAALERLCSDLRGSPYIAVDTEFMGEKTYFAKLCLIQVAYGEHSAAIDPLASNLDLASLASLLADPDLVKVLHSGRQDMQILLRRTGQLPTPVFDTQIAATVCDMGEQPGYDKLVSRILGIEIDKSSQLTDWSIRPLSDRQLAYALADVTHLCDVYERLTERLEQRGRAHWVSQEMEALLDPEHYVAHPRQAFKRIKIRKPSRRSLAILRELAAWREETAIDRDLPRGWVARDEALAEIALAEPRDRGQLGRIRGLKGQVSRGDDGQDILEAIKRAVTSPESDWPASPQRPSTRSVDESMVALLQALLRLRCDDHGVAKRLVASRADLEKLAVDAQAQIPALVGWRREIFGEDALALRNGRLALTGRSGTVTTHRIEPSSESPGDEA